MTGSDRPRPDLSTPQGRIEANRYLNERLPKKRVIAQGLLRDDTGAVLLCELTYKREWDLPGGVVDPDESPATCVAREVREELGVDVTVGALLAVNWLPPYRGWDDALLCLFDLGVAPAGFLDDAVLLPREIRAVHWCPLDALADHVAPYVAQMVTVAAGGGPTAYLENSRHRAEDR